MSTALYRKYRPSKFADVSGQNHIKVVLQNEIESSRVAHAYLFCGPRGTGKTTLARLLAKSVNCTDIQPAGEACGKCPSCLDILENKSMDIIEIDAASHTGVDNVRENIIQNARFTPVKAQFKVFIIDEVHMLSTAAFNALLKILEEPPKYVVFILATTEAHKVPSTIISRCQRFDFKKVNHTDLVDRLRWMVGEEGVKVDEAVLSLVSKQSGGCVRDAESLLEQVLSLGEKNITMEQAELILPRSNYGLLYNFFELIINKQTKEALEFVDNLVKDGIDVSLFIDSFVEFVRKVLLYILKSDLAELSREVDDDVVQKIVSKAKTLSVDRLVNIIKKSISCKEDFKQSYIMQLPLEMIIFDLAQSGISQPIPAVQLSKEKVVEPKNEEIGKVEFSHSNSQREEAPVAEEEPLQAPEPQPEPIVDDVEVVIKKPVIPGNLGEFAGKWDVVLNKVRDKNYSLYMSLRMSKPINFVDDVLSLGFLFELQKQRIDNLEARNLLHEILQDVAGRKVMLETRLDLDLKLEDFNSNGGAVRSGENQVQDLADEFGGEVIDKI